MNRNQDIFQNKIQLYANGVGAFIALVLTNILFLFSFLYINFLFGDEAIGVKFLPGYFIVPIIYLFFYCIVTTKTRNVSISYKYLQVIKRFFDVIIASLSLFLLLPLYFLIGIAIKIESSGPIIVSSKRVGQFGQLFNSYNFRTTYHDSGDDSLTIVGKFLQLPNLHILPNYYNVLEGVLSLVGPFPRQVSNIENLIDSERKILSVKPGLTGLWQLSDRKMDLIDVDLRYIDNWSLFLDLKIIIKTPFIVFLKKPNT
jgi:lipopolysaccharide/colanic/teichoic acid biosynthesis glycosyltransferase